MNAKRVSKKKARHSRRLLCNSFLIPSRQSPSLAIRHTHKSTEDVYNNQRSDKQAHNHLTMANPMDAITTGCLRRVFAGEQIMDPVVQCVQIKPMNNSASGVERFRVVFNDTVNFIQSMLAQQTNHIVHDGKLKKGSLVKLKQFQANSVKDKP